MPVYDVLVTAVDPKDDSIHGKFEISVGQEGMVSCRQEFKVDYRTAQTIQRAISWGKELARREIRTALGVRQ